MRMLVGVLEGFQNRLGDGQGAADRQGPLGAQDFRQRAPFAVGHHVEDETFAFTDEMDRQGVGMTQAGDRAGLLLEAGQRGGAPGHVVAQDLDRQSAVQVVVLDLVHLGEAAPTEQADDPVVAPQGAGKHCLAPGQGRGRSRRSGQVLAAEEGEAAGAAAGAVDGAFGKGRATARAHQQSQGVSCPILRKA
jgi:hypothetical protein